MKALNKIDNKPGYFILGVCKKIIRKLKYSSFTIFDKGTASFKNGNLFTALEENATLIKHFGPMHIYFDEYPPYSGAISGFFETNTNAHIWCDHGCPYSKIKGNIFTWINTKSW